MNVKAVFLDRDGVLNEDPKESVYVKHPDAFRLIPGAAEAIGMLNTHLFKVWVVSNQAGVGRGLFSPQDLDQVTQKMKRLLKQKNAAVDGVFYCTHLEEDRCDCRKPKPGLFYRAAGEAALDKSATYSIGDSERDMEAARQFGCRSLLVLSGKTSHRDVERFKTKPDEVFGNLKEAVEWILKRSAS